MNFLKDTLREILIALHMDLTTNLKYDRLTRKILKEFLKDDHNCIDVGCHKGEILDMMLKFAPNGKHYGFEPIPYLFNDLKKHYDHKAMILPYALANENGNTTFQLVENAPAYSGIKQRHYDVANPMIKEINVEMKRLDELIPDNMKVNFMKIDVEGAELGVLQGGKEILKAWKPIILFEFGKGASDYYGTTPEIMHDFMVDIGLEIYTLDAFLKYERPIPRDRFVKYFDSNEEYYFVAAKR